MKKFDEPELSVTTFEVEDIITASFPDDEEDLTPIG